MSALLTPEEIDYIVAHISPEPIPDPEKVHDTLVDAGARTQLRKVVAEIEILQKQDNQPPHDDPVMYSRWESSGYGVSKWIEAARKELG